MLVGKVCGGTGTGGNGRERRRDWLVRCLNGWPAGARALPRCSFPQAEAGWGYLQQSSSVPFGSSQAALTAAVVLAGNFTPSPFPHTCLTPNQAPDGD